MCPISAKIVRRAAACCPPANKAAYSASAALATTHGIMVEKQWMSPLICVGRFALPRKRQPPATERA